MRLNPSFRKPTLSDVERMFVVRRNSILGLASPAMSVSQATEWASKHTIETFTARFKDRDFWLAEVDNVLSGWVAIRGDRIDGLYVDPPFVGEGIGSALLRLAEGTMLSAGVTTARLDASWNAEGFYLRQGYGPDSPRPHNETRTFTKSLLKTPHQSQTDRQTILMLAGLPGTGKTTLAYAIARRLPFIVLDKDLIDSVLLNGALQQDRASPLAYEVLLRLADDLVAVQHRSVILDTAGRQPIVLDRASQIARKSCRSATRSNPALKELTLVVS